MSSVRQEAHAFQRRDSWRSATWLFGLPGLRHEVGHRADLIFFNIRTGSWILIVRRNTVPAGDQYRCKSCNEELLVLPKYFHLSPFPEKWLRGPSPTATPEEGSQRRRDILDWTRLHQQTFICESCELMLFLPRDIDAATWNQWKRKDSLSRRPYTDYPFLLRLAGLVDEMLAAKPDCTMEFGRLSCPYCSRLLVSKDHLSPKCKRCGSTDLEHLDSGIATMSASFADPWPPIV